MGLRLAVKAFFKAWKGGDAAEKFVAGQEEGGREKPAKEKKEHSHLRLLTLLQNSSRLIDFLKEDISSFNDAQVGAAVRKIHEDCGKSLENFVTIRPLFTEGEGATVTVPQGYDPSEIKVVGKVTGKPPYQGVIRHKGWKAHKHSLPAQVGEQKNEVLAPAEIEVK